ncbi:MAG: UbiD family decarboxylase [Halopseudomonas sp.]
MQYAQADLRSFLKDADDAGLLLNVDKPVDVETQIAALCSETKRPTLFNNLPGFDGFRLTDCLTRFRPTQALALGLPLDQPGLVMPGYLGKLAQGPMPTVTLDDAPVKEVVLTGDDAKLSRLPIPVPSEGTDFAHLGIKQNDFHVPTISGAMGVTRHPDGTLNTFFTMAKVVGERQIHFFLLPGHTQKNVDAWAELGQKCPMALVTGCHPLYEMGACYTGPHPGFSEFNLISTLLGAPVPMVKAETLDMEIPALGEIVIEGFIDPQRTPYLHASSHSDSYAPIFSLEPSFEVSAITMRKDPIYRHIQPTRFTEHHSLAEFISMPPLFKMLMDKGLPVRDIHMPLQACGNCALIQISANNPAEVREVMQTAMANPIAPRLAIVVDEDVDIYDMYDVLFALSIRVNGILDIEGYNGVRGLPEPLTMLINGPEDIQMLPNNRWVIDATKPSLAEPNRRQEFVRLQARGEGQVKLADFL